MENKNYIIGADECGYGSWAGPLVVCGLRAPKDWSIQGLNDSKKLTDGQRRTKNDELLKLVNDGTIRYSIASRDSTQIDALGLGMCLKQCYFDVVNALYDADSYAIIDGNANFHKYLSQFDYITMIKADTKVPAVMAASIMGKVYRDNLMIELAKDERYSKYGLDRHKGYIIKTHIEAVNQYGLTDIHRKSYKVKGFNKE